MIFLWVHSTTRVILLLILLSRLQAQPQLWHQSASGNIGPAMQVLTIGKDTIIASVYNKGILCSTDAGGTWKQIASDSTGTWTMGLTNNGLVASLWSEGIFSSTNNGLSWLKLPSSREHADIRGVNKRGEIFIEAEGRLYRSDTAGGMGGGGWLPASIGAGVMHTVGDTLYAAKGTGLHASADNGETWMSHSETSSSIYALTLSAAGTIIAGRYFDESAGAPSISLLRRDAEDWITAGPRATINALLARDDGALFAASHDSGFYCSLDDGMTWKPLNRGLTTSKVYALAFLSDTAIVAGTLDGMFITRNLSAILSAAPDDDISHVLPRSFDLMQNFPNPFNPSTTVMYVLPAAAHVRLTISDLLGRKIAEPVNSWQHKGEHRTVVEFEGLPSGIYVYTLRAGGFSGTKKMVLLR